jgi:para-aminobenzoate synthetase
VITSLLVDNYDSYTFNLFNLMTQVNGVEPVVRRNDDPALPDALRDVDCVVISPGPGDPRTEQDFGGCAPLLRSTGLPVLGVCLGHQGIGVHHGAVLERAPAPRHGHVSRIKHNGDELFHGIPQDFPAVRYHSLALTEPLPDGLEALAWAEDGVLMALRHRELPLWGVQFHPESVLTQYGATLLGNFRAAVERTRAHTTAAPAARAAHRYTAHVTTVPALPDPEALHTALSGGSDRAVWLDSAAERADTGRFSYLAQASPALGELLTYRVGDDHVLVDAGPRGTRREPGTVFDVLEAELGRRHVDAPELPFDFTGGYVGYFGYELKGDLGAANRHASDLPDAVWAFTDRIAVLDRLDRAVHLVALATDDPGTQDAARSWLETAGRTVADLAAAPAATPAGPAPVPAPDPAAARALAEASLERDRRTYLADIAAVMDKLRAGESYEVCLTNTARLPAPPDPFAYYRTLRRLNAAPYAAYLSLGAVTVACSSPERFLRVTRDRVVESKPIKGTAPRGATPAQDAAIAAELATSAKTTAENLMIVDLLRNDLSQVCVPGSVHVPALMRVESYATVHQLVSTVRGLLREGTTAVSCARACFPGGSMTGAPKRRTMEIIDDLETSARGVYSGAIGFLACNGTADLNIAIRTAVFAGDRMRIGAGGAIVLDSDPVEEFEEVLLKAAATLRAHPAATPGAPPPPPPRPAAARPAAAPHPVGGPA